MYIDDLLIVTKRTKQRHINKVVRELLKILDEANLQLKAEKCTIVQESKECQGYIFTRTGISPIIIKAMESWNRR